MQDSTHFKGKKVKEHLTDARLKGISAVAEIHGTEIPGHISAFCDAMKDSSLLILLLFMLFHASESFNSLLILFSLALILWKTGRSSLLGYNRIERLHRLIEEERWEIEHHRDQERQELVSLYEAKGFSGKLLNDVVDVLMSDDNRLLQVMLEEELGLKLEHHEHPLKQAFGAFLGTASSCMLLIASIAFLPEYTLIGIGGILVILASFIEAKYEKRGRLHASIWAVAVFLFTYLITYFTGLALHEKTLSF